MTIKNKQANRLRFSTILLCCFGLEPAISADDMQRIENLWIDRTEVTIAEFSKFISATGTTTIAEEVGGLVYDAGWQRMPGWNWKTPFGSEANEQLPAVHLTFDEAAEYCEWADKRLPTNLEWQTAAYTEFRTHATEPLINGKTYPYPTGASPTGANCLKECGSTTAIDFSEYLTRGVGPAPVATSTAGVNGLYDMGANVWEWTDIDNQSNKGTRGGSWWYGAAQMERNHQATKPRDTAAVYIGFRCVRDE